MHLLYVHVFATARRANAQQPKLFVGMILILIFAEALALYGLIGGLDDSIHFACRDPDVLLGSCLYACFAYACMYIAALSDIGCFLCVQWVSFCPPRLAPVLSPPLKLVAEPELRDIFANITTRCCRRGRAVGDS